MTKSTITRERLEKIKSWRETYGAGSNVMLPAEEAEELARMALAAMDSEPVCFVSERNLATLTKYRAAVKVKAEPVMVRPVALYRHAQQPVVPAEWTIADAVKFCKENGRQDAGAAMDAWNACRAATLQAGNSPVIPDGYVMVPKEPTPEILATITEAIRAMRGSAATYARVLAAAPQPQNAPQNIPEIIPGWIPVSERIPENEQEVITINKMGHRFVSFFDKHSGLFFDRLDAPAACCIEHVLVTHWMPLPAAPQEVKGE